MVTETDTPKKRGIILIHGVRTPADWQEIAAQILGNEATDIFAHKNEVGFIDLHSIFVPWFRRRAVTSVDKGICEYLDSNKDIEVTIVAHSFGTYAVGSVLKQRARDERFKRVRNVLLIASILPQGFDWGGVKSVLSGLRVVYHYSHFDGIPVLAGLLWWNYGASGSFGSSSPSVDMRRFEVGHSGYFTEADITEHWKPVVNDEEIPLQSMFPPRAIGQQFQVYFFQLLTISWIRFLLMPVAWVLMFGIIAGPVVLAAKYLAPAIVDSLTDSIEEKVAAEFKNHVVLHRRIDDKHNLIFTINGLGRVLAIAPDRTWSVSFVNADSPEVSVSTERTLADDGPMTIQVLSQNGALNPASLRFRICWGPIEKAEWIALPLP